ncbi:MAG: hypothetical protein HND48_24615 [Chloroflexi bacterium]|nr:hypothetical protein [Chloroflexota bacterium]
MPLITVPSEQHLTAALLGALHQVDEVEGDRPLIRQNDVLAVFERGVAQVERGLAGAQIGRAGLDHHVDIRGSCDALGADVAA